MEAVDTLEVQRRDAHTVKVWDPLVRIFHWSLALSVFAAFFFTEEGDQAHEIAGYIALGLVAFRVVWGLVGTRYARFAQFVPGPSALMRYLGEVVSRKEGRYLGHNPAGGAMVVMLLLMVVATGVSGWMLTTDAYFGEEWVEELHEVIANALMVMVAFHVLGVIYTSLHHGENLIRAMITGRKRP